MLAYMFQLYSSYLMQNFLVLGCLFSTLCYHAQNNFSKKKLMEIILLQETQLCHALQHSVLLCCVVDPYLQLDF